MNWDKVNDFGHYYEEDALYPEVKRMLQEELDSGKGFDTGWHGFKDEFESMRISADQHDILIEVYSCMDDMPELIFDIDGSESLTDDQISKIEKIWNEGFDTKTTGEKLISRNSTIEDIMISASDISCWNDAYLNDCFLSLKRLVEDAKNGLLD